MAGRTVNKHTRVYVGGYDLSGYASSIGPLQTQFEAAGITCFTDAVKGIMPNQPMLSPGTLQGVFDNTATTGLHTLHAASAGSAAVHSGFFLLLSGGLSQMSSALVLLLLLRSKFLSSLR